MKREWRPGNVAMVTGPLGGQYVAIKRAKSWDAGVTLFQPGEVLSARPLVVIDPEDREQVERLAEAVVTTPNLTGWTDRMQAALREFANPTPAKPEEPTGLGAVVEDANGRRWVRDVEGHDDDGPWYRRGVAKCRQYAEIAAVRVLSEGVTNV